MKKNIYDITFHGSYNYGSSLQAYALQEYVNKLCDCDYKIVNLRTDVQKKIYKNVYELNGFKNNLKKIIYYKYKKDILGKKEKFESFINDDLNVTKEYSKLEKKDFKTKENDYFITGSDQVWNIHAWDFDWSNFLEFTNSNNKISYAASFGPIKYQIDDKQKNRIKEDLSKYKSISVREEGSKKFIEQLVDKDININVDPTMLLKMDEWKKIISEKPLLNYDYILLYDLKCKKDTYEIAKQISKKLKMPVVITKFNGCKDVFLPFKKYINCGPREFLNLEYNAKLILSTSFHGNVFATIFHKPFFAINGDKDNRISQLLKITKLENRSVNLENLDERLKYTYDIEFDEAEKYLEIERNKSEEYLKKALDIE